MTEQEWLESGDPQAMLRWLGEPGVVSGSDPEGRAYQHRVTTRKLRLFACACVRQVWHLLTDEGRSRKAVEVAELFADGSATADELNAALGVVWAAARDAVRDAGLGTALDAALGAAIDAGLGATGAAALGATLAATWDAGLGATGATALGATWDAARVAAWAKQATILRDVVGNPWSPVMRIGVDWGLFMHHDRHLLVYERWLTPTVLAVARAAYDERPGRKCKPCGEAKAGFNLAGGVPGCPHCDATGRIADGALDQTNLLVLADALEDAGCDAGELLGHLRSPGPHVRGCWAVDLVVGKE